MAFIVHWLSFGNSFTLQYAVPLPLGNFKQQPYFTLTNTKIQITNNINDGHYHVATIACFIYQRFLC